MAKAKDRLEANKAEALALRGHITSITFQSDDWMVARFRVTDESSTLKELDLAGSSIKITGNFYQVNPGDELKLWGSFKKHPKYGEQFVVDRYERPLPTGRQAIEDYLASGLISGVGPALAKRICDCFGDQALEVALKNPESLARVRGISRAKAEVIGRAVAETQAFQQVVSFLYPYGVSAKMAVRIYRHFGSATLDRIRENPYILTEVKMIGFVRADAIARHMGIAEDSPYRVRAAISHVLEEAASQEGHCYLPRSEIISRTLSLLDTPGVTAELVDDALGALLRTGKVIEEQVEATGEEGPYAKGIFLPSYRQWEEKAAAKVKELLEAAKAGAESFNPQRVEMLLSAYEKRTGLKLAPEQRQAVVQLVEQGILILTGGPGTGKTQTTRAAIEVYRELKRGQGHPAKVALAAPTGRASRRMAEVTGCPASTIHRLLALTPEGGPPEPIKADLVIVDEFSMVDILLFYQLLEALTPGTRLLLVGDTDQLPSVGPGRVLHDLLQAGIPAVTLTKIFRQAAESQIVVNAHRLNQGSTRLATGKDFHFLVAEEPQEIRSLIRHLAREHLRQYGDLEEFQVLSPMKKGPLGSEALNRLFQEEFNPPSKSKSELRRDMETVFRVGDKVIQLSNDYQKKVFNGDVGTVIAVRRADTSRAKARATNLSGAGGSEEEAGKSAGKGEPVLVVHFSSPGAPDEVEYTRSELDALALAYAITVHKGQGSEYGVVVMPVVTQHYVMLARNLIYTGVTRARKRVILVGSRKALAIAVRNTSVRHRYTSLAFRLKRLLAHPSA